MNLEKMLHYKCYAIGLNHVDLTQQEIVFNKLYVKIGKENIVHNCVFNIEWVTDAAEKELAKARLHSQGGSVDGIPVSGRRLDEGFESDEEYERRRHGKSIDIDDPYVAVPKQRSTDMSEGRKTPTASSEFPSRKSSSKLGDFGIVNIVQEITPTDPPIESTEQITEPTTSQMLDDLHNLETTNIQSSINTEAQIESRNQ